MIEKYVTPPFFTNTYVLSKGDDCIVIDPSLNFKDKALEIIDKYNVKAVFLTHAHIDHIDGIQWFKEYPIYITKEEYNYIHNNSYNLYSFFQNSKIFNLNDYNFNLLYEGDKIPLLDSDIEVIITPGHTLGGACYRYKDMLFTGDTLFKESIGRTDFPGGDESSILRSVKRIIEEYPDNTILYPGHDEKTTIRDERKNNLYYKEAKKRF